MKVKGNEKNSQMLQKYLPTYIKKKIRTPNFFSSRNVKRRKIKTYRVDKKKKLINGYLSTISL